MTSRNLSLIAAALVLILSLTGYLIWRNSPAQVAKRYLNKLARTATVYPEHSVMNRRLRAPKLAGMLADPMTIRIPAANYNGSFEQEELLSGYVAVVSDDHYFQVTFSQIKLLENRDDGMTLEAHLDVQSDYPSNEFPVREPVTLEISKLDDLLLLSGVSTRSPSP